MFKKLKWIVIGVLVLIIVIIGGVILYADHLTKIAVETAGSQALGVPTTLDKADISFLGGSVSLEGLLVANPSGYETSNLLLMKNASAKIRLSSITSDTVSVEIIRLENLVMTIEQKGAQSNLGQILKNIEEFAKTEKPKPETESGKKIAFQKIEIIKPVARIKFLPIPGQVEVIPIQLGDITLENISQDRNKAELTVVVIQKVLISLAEAVVKSGVELPAGLIEGLSESVIAITAITDESIQIMIDGTGVILEEGVKVLEEGAKALEEIGKGVEEIIKLPDKIIKTDKK